MSVVLNGSTGITAPGLETFGDGTALGGATNPIVSMAKGANNYVQGYVVNNTAGTSSSADLVTYPDNGADAHGWVDMGITSSVYADATYTVTGPNEAYLFGSAPSGAGKTGNLVIATDNTGTANSIQFYTNGFTQAKSAAKMVIDGATGNVGIGTSSFNYSSAGRGLVELNGSSSAMYAFKVGGVGKGYLYHDGTNLFLQNGASGVTVFYGSSGNESMRLDSSGNLLVGTTASTANITTSDNTTGFSYQYGLTQSSGGCFTVKNDNSIQTNRQGNTDGATVVFRRNGTQVGSISVTSTLTAYNVSSDYRLKENIVPLTGALDKIAQLKPSLYNYKADSSTNIEGFIAHELQEIVPHAVIGEKDAVDDDGNPVYQGVDASFLIPHLVAAVQELKAEIDALKASK